MIHAQEWLLGAVLLGLPGLVACASPIVDDSGDDAGTGGSATASGGAPGASGGSPGASGGAGPSTGGAPSGGAASGGSTSACGDGVGSGDFQALQKVGNTTDPNAYVTGEIKVDNIGPAVAANTLKIRYYFTTEVADMKVTVNWANYVPSGAGATATLVPMTAGEVTATADYYIEFALSGTEAITSVRLSYQMEPMNPAASSFTKSNDYSYDPTSTADTVAATIVVLENDVVVWGNPPC